MPVALFSLNGSQIERVTDYKYLCIWLEEKLSFKTHMIELTKKVRIKLGALDRIHSCFSFENRMTIV